MDRYVKSLLRLGLVLLALLVPHGWSQSFHHRAGGDLQGVYFHDANNGWIAEEGGRIRHTTDGGATWTFQDSTDAVRHILRGIFFLSDGVTGWACGNEGFVLGTTDGGANWTLLTDPGIGGSPVLEATGNPAELFAVYFFNSTDGWVVGNRGVLMKTTDGGLNWAFPSGCTYPPVLLGFNATNPADDWDAYDVHFVSSTTGFVPAEWGQLLKTTDGGCTWTTTDLGALISPSLPGGANLELWNIDFRAPTGLGFVVSGEGNGSGYMFATADYGVNWSWEPCQNYLISATTFATYGVSSVPGTRGAMSCGYSSQVMVRTAGVPTQCWTETSPTAAGANPPLLAIESIDTTHAWVVGMFNIIRFSNDNGSTWTAQAGVNYNRLWGGDFLSSTTGCVIGQFYGIHRTTNGGQTWTQVNANSSASGGGFGRSLAFNSAGTKAVAVGDHSTAGTGSVELVLYSTDAGVTWSAVSTTLPFSASSWKSVCFVPGTDTVFAAGLGGRVMKSTDAGQNWSSSASGLPGSFGMTGIKFYDANNGYAVGSDGARAVYTTTNGGSSWSSMSFSGGSSGDVPIAVDADGTLAYAVGAGGVVYKLVSGQWTVQSLGLSPAVTSDLLSVDIVPSSSEVYVGGAGGVVLHFDGSSTWSNVKSQTESDIRSVSFQSTSQGFIVGRQFLVCEFN